MNARDEFIKIFNENITRQGASRLLEYLCSDASDFFDAPCSTRFHGSYDGGLVEHSVNVYHCLKAYLERERCKTLYNMNYTDETIALVSLLHDVCKINTYKRSTRNVKGADGVWRTVPSYEFEDTLPYGHGEKSVYIISGFMRLSREEAFAVRYHMGFSGIEDKRAIGDAFEMFPLAFALSVADMEATYYLEGKNKNENNN